MNALLCVHVHVAGGCRYFTTSQYLFPGLRVNNAPIAVPSASARDFPFDFSLSKEGVV